MILATHFYPNQVGKTGAFFSNFKALGVLFFMTLALSSCDQHEPRWALGTLERDRVILKTTANEIIVAQPVAEGQMVKAGELIVKLDDNRQKAIVSKSQAEVARARAVFDKLSQGARIEDIDAASSQVDGAKAILLSTQKDYQRTRKLLKKGLVSQGVLDKAIAAKDSASANLTTLKEKLRVLTNGNRKEDIDQAKASLDAAIAQLKLANINLADLNIKATRNGYLDSLPWNVGERVAAGSNVAIILADTAPFARVYIPEPFRVKIKIGDALPVKIDGLDKIFTGKVRWISSDPSFTPYFALNESDRSRLVYVAEVAIQPQQKLPTGLPVQVELPQ